MVMRMRLLVGLALLLACRGTPVDPAASIQVSADVSRAAFRAGDAVTIRVTALNAGPAPVRIGISGCPVWFEILSGTTMVAPGATACTLMAVERHLAPSESYTAEYQWYGGTRSSPTGPADPLVSGMYALRGRVAVDGTIVRGATVDLQLLP
jgi:hypothetical protein